MIQSVIQHSEEDLVMYNVHVRPVRDLRNNYPELARIIKNQDQVVITNNGRGEAVLIHIVVFVSIFA